jgi:hypothetical protein
LPSPAESGPGLWYGSGWVGLDDNNTIIQSGVDWGVEVTSSGEYVYEFAAWYEWFPAGAIYFGGFDVNAGDEITVFCVAGSTTSADCAVRNAGTGVTVNAGFNTPSSSSALQAKNADWVVEDFGVIENVNVPFANFGAVTFTDCVAIAGPNFSNGQDIYPSASTATDLEIVDNSSYVITAVTFPANAPQVVEVNYLG